MSPAARMLFLAWKHGGECPYRMAHTLDTDFRPLGRPSEPPRPPAHPGRLVSLKLAFGILAEREAVELATGKKASAGR